MNAWSLAAATMSAAEYGVGLVRSRVNSWGMRLLPSRTPSLTPRANASMFDRMSASRTSAWRSAPS